LALTICYQGRGNGFVLFYCEAIVARDILESAREMLLIHID